MDNNYNNIGHNSLNNKKVSNIDLKTTKKGFYVNYNKSGYRIDHYNTSILRRFLRKILINIGIFETFKNFKRNMMVKFFWIKKVKENIQKIYKK